MNMLENHAPPPAAINTMETFKLVDGTFSARDATDLLLALVKSKIDFHTMEKASNQERFGRDTAHSERRLVQLRQLQDKLRLVCKTAAENGEDVQVNGWLEITLVRGEDRGSTASRL